MGWVAKNIVESYGDFQKLTGHSPELMQECWPRSSPEVPANLSYSMSLQIIDDS